MRRLQSVYREIRDRFDRKYSQIDAEKFVERYCAELELDQTVEEVAQVAITRTDGELSGGIAPDKIAVGAIYYACETLGRDVTQREIADVARCTPSTVSKTWNLVWESIEPE